MRVAQGLYNNHGYVQIRVWPWSAKSNPKPYTESGFGCWCEKHIKEAERRLRLLRDEIETGKFTRGLAEQLMTFPACWDLFYRKHYVLKERSAGCRRVVGVYGNKFKALWPNLQHHEFTPRHIQEDFINPSLAAGLKGSTLHTQLGILQGYFNRIEDWSKTHEIEPVKLPLFNPVEPLEKPNSKYTGRKHLELGELRRYKDWCLQNDPDLWTTSFAAMTTLLRHGDLETQAGKVHIQGVASKTGKILLLPGSVPQLGKLENFRRRWHRARREAGIGWFHWHWWRAQGGKLMRILGIDEKTVQEIYQHSTVQQTRAYTGDPEWARPAVEKVQDFLNNLDAKETV